VESVGRQIPIAFLERIKDDFNKRYGGGRATTATAKSLNKEFGYLIMFIILLYNIYLLVNYSIILNYDIYVLDQS